MKRRAARYRVCVSLVYEAGGARRRARVENLSRHGLFVCPGSGLEEGTEVEVAIEFPGAEGSHRCRVRVAHRLDEGEAGAQGRRAGAGLELARAEGGFQDALDAYLERLGRRGDALVWAVDEASRRLLAAAGYHVEAGPEPGEIAAALGGAPAVLALVVTAAAATPYADALRGLGRDDLVVTMNAADDVERVLAALDARL